MKREKTAIQERIRERLARIYPGGLPDGYLEHFYSLVEKYKIDKDDPDSKWNEKDVVMITYGDSILDHQNKPLDVLADFLEDRLKGLVNIVHILPFFPYTSDDGFSVVDYKKVNPELGDWQHIEQLSTKADLMFDLVINHISQKSEWFQNYLEGVSPGKDYFIEADPGTDLSGVVRPRSLPLLTGYQTKNGKKHVWTTFSPDQVDLNFGNPGVLLAMMEVLLFYIEKGARIIRLDAIAFLWKKIGTSCLHLPETHEVVKLMRDISEYVDPASIILTETNVPNKENLSYFGKNDEAHMVYQFSLPPLLLHALHTGNDKYLNQWAKSIPSFSDNRTFFNFTASHDGIGVRPLEGILPTEEIGQLLENMIKQGGQVSTKTNSDGTDSPYEINITYYDALLATNNGPDQFQAQRFLCSQTIMLSLQGIPAFYIHSLTSTKNYQEGVKETGRARTINRKKWEKDELLAILEGENEHAMIFDELTRRISIKKQLPAFHPNAHQEIMDAGQGVFCFKRISMDQGQEVIVASNLQPVTKSAMIFDNPVPGKNLVDALTGNKLVMKNGEIKLDPYQVVWVLF